MSEHEHVHVRYDLDQGIEIPTIDEYLDNAMAVQDLTSDRQLAKMLGVAPSIVNNWRKKKNWPSDYKMQCLAELSGAVPDQALLALNYWRAPRTVKPVYSHLLAMLDKAIRDAKSTAAGLVVLLGFVVGGTAASGDAEARTQQAQTVSAISETIYYAYFSVSISAVIRPLLTLRLNIAQAA